PDIYNIGVSNGTLLTAANLNGLINPTTLTGLVTDLDITNAGQAEYFTVNAPAWAGGALTVAAQSSGLSLLSPKVTVYAADGGPPTIVGISPDTGASSNDGVTAATRISPSGVALPNVTVSVYRDGSFLGNTAVDAQGNWTFNDAATSLPQGTSVFTATLTDPA